MKDLSYQQQKYGKKNKTKTPQRLQIKVFHPKHTQQKPANGSFSDIVFVFQLVQTCKAVVTFPEQPYFQRKSPSTIFYCRYCCCLMSWVFVDIEVKPVEMLAS
jgi:hypothetical protein